MAKKAKRRPLRVSKTTSAQAAESSEMQQYNAATIIHPSPSLNVSHKRRCGLAHAKHTTALHITQSKREPTFGDRFHALPAELRAEIFALLLVRPVKWQLPHQTEPEECPRITNTWPIRPHSTDYNTFTCVRCWSHHHNHNRLPLWRAFQDPDPNVDGGTSKAGGLGLKAWTSPWRSQWAPPIQNEFLCSDCWDLDFRPRPHPAQEEVSQTHLRCLCARRQDLGILLVCRRWCEEAGAVFYSRNTFAFESSAVFTSFITSLPQRWKDRITRLSIMAHHPDDPTGPIEASSGWEGNRKLSRIWPLLHNLPRLSYLELDAHFLSRAKTAHHLLKLTLRNVRRVCFVMHKFLQTNSHLGSEWVWPEYQNARLVVGGFAEEVARAIKGQRPRRGLRRTECAALRRACAREEDAENHVMGLKSDAYPAGMGAGNVYYATSASAYARLWWTEQKQFGGGNAAHFSRLNGLHAYLPTEYTHLNAIRAETREGHWREWTPTSLQQEDFGLRNLAVWREAAGWQFLLQIHPEEFLDETQKEWRGWEALAGIET